MSLLTDLVECFELGEASGDTTGSHAGLVLTAVNNPGTATGKVGNCRDFESSSTQYFSRADDATFSLGSYTPFMVCAWVKLESNSVNQSIASKYNTFGGSLQREWGLDYDQPSNRFRFFVSNSPSLVVVTDAVLGAPSLGVWYYVIGWLDTTANTLNLQINNGTVTSTAYSVVATYNSTTAFMIGAITFGAGLSTFDGLIDQFLFYKGSFQDSTGRTQLYNSGNGLSYAAMTGVTFKSAWARNNNIIIQVA